MICKLVCYGNVRSEAIETSLKALDSYVIRGNIFLSCHYCLTFTGHGLHLCNGTHSELTEHFSIATFTYLEVPCAATVELEFCPLLWIHFS
jgi:hypothetical protein